MQMFTSGGVFFLRICNSSRTMRMSGCTCARAAGDVKMETVQFETERATPPFLHTHLLFSNPLTYHDKSVQKTHTPPLKWSDFISRQPEFTTTKWCKHQSKNTHFFYACEILWVLQTFSSLRKFIERWRCLSKIQPIVLLFRLASLATPRTVPHHTTLYGATEK